MNIGQIMTYQSVNGSLAFSIPLAAVMFFMLLLTKSPYYRFKLTGFTVEKQTLF